MGNQHLSCHFHASPGTERRRARGLAAVGGEGGLREEVGNALDHGGQGR